MRLGEFCVGGRFEFRAGLLVAILTGGALALNPRVLGQQSAQEGVTFTDERGQEHVNARMLRAEPGVIVIMSASGVSRLPMAVVPSAVKQKLGVTDAMMQTAPGGPPAPQDAAMPGNPPATAPAASLDEIELAKIRSEIERVTQELRGLENSRKVQKDDYNSEFAAAKKRLDSQYELALQDYEKKARHRRNPGDPPTRIDPDEDPDVAKVKARLDQYDEQIRDREKWLKDTAQRERQVADRIAAVRRAESDAAVRQRILDQRAEAQRRTEEERQRHQAMYSESRRRVEEREEQEKKEAEARDREVSERLEKIAAECAAIAAQGQGGDVRGAFLKLEALNADRRMWDFPGSAAAKRIAALAVDLFGLARRSDELAIATSSLRIANSIDPQNARLSEEMMRFFDEAAVLVRGGDFPALTHHLEFIKEVGLESSNLVNRKKHELSDLALDRGWQALRGLNFATAGSAIETARRLWDRNPRLGWFRTTVSGSFFVGVLLGLFVIFKGVEKLYWWLNRS